MKRPEQGKRFFFKKSEFSQQNSLSFVPLFTKLTIGLFVLSSLGGLAFASSVFIPPLLGTNKNQPTLSSNKQVDRSVLAASTKKLLGKISFNIPSYFTDTATFEKATTFNGKATFNNDIQITNHNLDLGTGQLTASNVVYSVTGGDGISVTGGQRPVVTNTGVLSVQGQTGAVSFLAGSGITFDGLTVNNTGVTSLQGQSGAVTLTAGSGISINGTTISSTSQSSGNAFGNITVGGTTIAAGSTSDTVTFTAGSGITLTPDATNKTLTFASTGGLSGLTTNGVLYATSGTTATSLTPGAAGFVLQSNGAGSPPSWVSNSSTSPSFSVITSGTNTSAAMVVGSGSSLTYTGTGTITASSVTGLSIASGKTFTVNNTLTLAGTDGTSFTLPSANDTLVGRDSTDTLTNKTIAAGSNTITGLTNANLSGTAGITNANLANSSVTVTAGTGLSGGGAVSLGSSVTLNNAGVLSLTGTPNQVNVSASTGNITLSLPQDIHTGASPTFAGLTLSNFNAGNNAVFYATSGTGALATTTTNTSSLCLVSGASAPTWGSCSGSGSTNYWNISNGTLQPINNTLDLLIGGTASSSAKFAVLNVNNGTPTASVSAGTNGGAYINASGTIASTNKQSLTLGDTNTGNIILNGFATGIIHSTSGVLSSSAINLAGSDITGTLGIGNGGTGLASTPTNGQLLIGNGSGYTLATLTGTPNQVNVANASGSITLSLPQSINSGASPTFAGLTLSNFTSNNSVLYATSGTGAITAATTNSSNFCLVSGASAPTWTACSGLGTNYWQRNADGGSGLNVLAPATIADTLSVGIANPLDFSGFEVDQNSKGNAVAVINQTGSGDILTASASGSPKFAITNNGSIEFNGNSGFLQTFTSNALAAKTFNFPNFSGSSVDICLSTGNCAGSGGGITGSGTSGQIAFFNGTGSITSESTGFAWDTTNKKLGVGNDSPVGKLDLNGAVKGKALAIFNETGDQDIFTASSAGTTRFTINNNGNIAATGTLTGLTGLTSSGTITFSGFSSNGGPLYTNGSGTLAQVTAGSSTQVLHGGTTPSFSAVSLTADVTGILPLANGGTNANLTAVNGGIIYSNASALAVSLAGTSGQCLLSGGAGTPTWGNCTTGGGTNYWTSTLGALYPINSTMDLLIGGTASSSAKFAVLNVNNGTPTASVSAGTNGGAYLSATGTLATTAKQALTLGDGNTGNIVLNGFATGIIHSTSGVLSSSAVNLANSDVTGTLGVSNGGTGIASYTTGDLIYASGTTTLAKLSDVATGSCLTSGGVGVAPGWTACSSLGTNYWQRNTDAASGLNVLSPATIADTLTVGITNPLDFSGLEVDQNSKGNATAVINQTGSGPIFTASTSGTPKFTINNNGDILATGAISGLTGLTSSGTITFSGFSSNGGPLYTNGSGVLAQTTAGSSTQVLHGGTTPAFGAVVLTTDVSGILPLANGGTNANLTAVNGGIVYSNASQMQISAAGTSGQCLLSGGAGTPTWGNCTTGGGTNYWTSTLGALYPLNSTMDLLIGGTASNSAKFAVLNVNNGTPTASVSAGTNGGSYLTAAGNLATTAMQTLTLGGSSTGNIILNPQNGSGLVGINKTPTKTFDVNGDAAITGGGNDVLTVASTFDTGFIRPLSLLDSNMSTGNNIVYHVGHDFTTNNTGYFGFHYTGSGSTDNYITMGFWGNDNLYNFKSSGFVGFGTQSPVGVLDLESNPKGNASLVVNNPNTTSALFTASAAGATKFTINNNGNIAATGTLTGLTGLTSSGTITFSGFTSNGGPLYTNGSGVLAQATAGTSTQVLHGGTTPSFGAVALTTDVSGILPLANGGTNANLTAVNGGIVYSNASQMQISAAGTSGQCLLSGGAGTPTWGSCTTGGGTNLWTTTNGAIYPINSTEDLLIGGTATSSAKFAFINNNSGTPTASISGNLAIAAPTGTNPSDTINIYNGGSLNFQTSVGGDAGLASRFYVANNGNVGIGTNNPARVMELVSNANTWDNTLGGQFRITSNDTAGAALTLNSTDTGGVGFSLVSGGSGNYAGPGSFGIYQNVGAGNVQGLRLAIDSTGDFGINSQTPLAVLDVRGVGNKTLPGTIPVASISGKTSFASLVVDNSGLGDIFTASSSGLNRFVIKQNGNVGIGTTAPSTPLHLSYTNGSTTAGNSVGFTITNTSTQAELSLDPGSTGNTWTLSANDDSTLFRILDGTTARLSIDASGNINLGNSSGAYQINGTNVLTSNTLGTGVLTSSLTTVGTIGTGTWQGTAIAANFGGTGLTTYTTGDLLYAGSTNPTSLSKLADVATGSCLISGGVGAAPSWGSCATGVTNYWQLNSGILTPATLTNKLSIGVPTNTTSLATLDLRSLNGTQPIASISGATSFAGLVVDNSGKGDLFTASSSGLNRFVITQAGNVGIGTTTPIKTLDIVGPNESFDNTNGAQFRLTANDTIAAGITLNNTSSGGHQFSLASNGFNSLAGAGAFSIYDHTAGSVRLDIASGGNIGIGTVNPSSFKLQVAGDIGPDAGYTYSLGSQANPWNSIFGKYEMLEGGGGFAVGNTDNLTVGGDGSSGFGNGTSATATIAAKTSFAALVTDNSGNGDLFAASSSGLNRFVITQNGNVGIGTTAPTAKLDVEGGNIMIGQQTNTSTTADMNWTDQVAGCTGACVPGKLNTTTGIASISASVVYNGSLYVGTWNANNAEVYRYNGTTGSWTAINTTAGTFDNVTTAVDAVTSMAVYNGYLYIGTTESNKAEVFRYNGGTGAAVFTLVTQSTAGTVANGGTASIDGISSMAVFQGKLYIGTNEPTKAETYLYDGGTTWTMLQTTTGTVCSGGATAQDKVTAMAASETVLYAAVSKGVGKVDFCFNQQGKTWGEITGTDGTFSFISGSVTGITDVTSMVSYNGALYIGLRKTSGAGDLVRLETQVGFGNDSFVRIINASGQVMSGGTSAIDSVSSMAVYNGKLYIGTEKLNSAEIYRYEGGDGAGSQWTKVSQATAGTIGPSSNSGEATSIDMISTMVPYNGSLFVGTYEPTKGEAYSITTVSNQSYALQFHAANSQAGGEQNSLQNIGSISFISSASANDNAGVSSTGSFLFSNGITTAFGAYDVAEDYGTRDDSLEPGDIVAMDTNEQQMVKKSTNSSTAMGIYSENPGFRLSQQDSTINGGRAVPIALAGRVPVKVSTENGPIHIGDLLTQSSIPGVAMKATKPGFMVARAFADYDNSDKTAIGKVMAFVNITWADPGVQLTSNGNLNIASTLPTDITAPIAQTALTADTNVLATTSASTSATMTDPMSQLGATVSLLQTQYASLSAQMNKLSKIDDLSNRIAALEKNVPLFSASSSGSVLGDATISGQLSVTGKTLLSDVGITGKVTMGLLTIDGLNENDATPAASINTTSGPLKLQSLAINGIDILNGKITIDVDGNMKTAAEITAKKYNVNIEDVKSASLGEATIPAGESKIEVPTTTVTKNSKIFVTAESLITQPLIVTEKKEGKSFTVQMTSPSSIDVKFNWWIVN